MAEAGTDGMDGRPYEEELGSRGGLSASEPSIDDIDMLLPGRCADPVVGGGSRGPNEPGAGGIVWGG